MSMRTTCVAIRDDGHRQETEMAPALERWRGGGGPFGILVEGGKPGEVREWLATLGLDQEPIDLFVEQGHTATILPMDEAVFFTFPGITENDPEDPISVTFICLDRLVVEIRARPVSDQATSDIERSDADSTMRFATLHEPSTSALVCSLLVGQSATVRRLAWSLRTQANRLAARMDDDPESVALEDIVALKARIRDLDEIVDEQLAVYTVLKVFQRPLLDLVHIADLFHVVITNTESTDRAVERLQREAADLQSRYDLNQQDKTNQRLGALTIISAIFLPLTLLAGIYGMNFDVMPELHFHYGYFAVLAGMAIIAGGLFWYFWSRGWIPGR